MYRKFWLENGLGQLYQLTDRNFKRFLNAPNGLGFIKDISVIQLGNREVITGTNYQMVNPQGELVFHGDNNDIYQGYFDYINFIKYQPIKFHYLPVNTLYDYYCEGTVAQTDKAEIGTDNVLRCPFYFKPTTHWLTANANVVEIASGTSGTGKSYPMSYPYHYSGTTLSDISLTNQGTLPTGFMLEINGETTNPQWSVSQGGLQYGIGKINGTYDYVRINSTDGEESIYLERNGSVIANAPSYQDLSIADGTSLITFVKLRVGESKLNLSLGNGFDGFARIQWRDQFVSV